MKAELSAAFLVAFSLAAAAEAPERNRQLTEFKEANERYAKAAAAIPVEIREVTTTAQFQRREGLTSLLLREGIFYFDLPWISHPPEMTGSEKPQFHYPVTLEAGKTYLFTFAEQRRHLFDEGLPVPTTHPFFRPQFYETELVRISQKGKVLHDREVCEVHHCQMPRVEVPVLYGLAPYRGKIPSSELRSSFPHFQDFALGGCVVMVLDGSPVNKTQPQFVCPECRKAYTAWSGEQKPISGNPAR